MRLAITSAALVIALALQSVPAMAQQVNNSTISGKLISKNFCNSSKAAVTFFVVPSGGHFILTQTMGFITGSTVGPIPESGVFGPSGAFNPGFVLPPNEVLKCPGTDPTFIPCNPCFITGVLSPE
jgi:hypothetical protein